MRVFIKTSMLGIPETETEYVAWQGFQALGYKPVFFEDERRKLMAARIKKAFEQLRINVTG